MRSALLSVFIFSTLVSAESAPPVIKSVTLHGTLLKVNLTTQVGQPFNADAIDKDVHQLWSTGRFGDIRVETGQQPDGADVIFNVVEAPRPELHKAVPEVHKAPPEDQHLHVKTVNFAGDPGIDPAQLRRALRALKARRIIPRVPGLCGSPGSARDICGFVIRLWRYGRVAQGGEHASAPEIPLCCAEADGRILL